ncbi:hypothetical protein CHUAL_007960 [Chamberlinius hualienensis]
MMKTSILAIATLLLLANLVVLVTSKNEVPRTRKEDLSLEELIVRTTRQFFYGPFGPSFSGPGGFPFGGGYPYGSSFYTYDSFSG